MSDRSLIAVIVCTFMLAFLAVAACFALIWHHWPWVTAAALGLVAIGSCSSAIHTGRVQMVLFGCGPSTPRPNEEADYCGIYQPHWEMPAICVFTGYRWFGLLPRFERWLPTNMEGLPPGAEGREGPWPRYILRFRGIASAPGRFGHMGMASRTVEVVSLLDATVVPDLSTVWT